MPLQRCSIRKRSPSSQNSSCEPQPRHPLLKVFHKPWLLFATLLQQMSFGKTIRKLRFRKRLRQEALRDLVSQHVTHIGRLQRGYFAGFLRYGGGGKTCFCVRHTMQCDGYSLGLRWSLLVPTDILKQGPPTLCHLLSGNLSGNNVQLIGLLRLVLPLRCSANSCQQSCQARAIFSSY